ncbi:hypothetical protein BO71DRAFT_409099 [Aspergillus ellipticus CBS 707.79]|uniref:HORMA domain-containing protein n=1 Tax=Aspergillus ellipticus CBS 707.79 TaxID=1448320 RepID=A0A319DBJ8_9EURO|nr:hypothetical protein BO71DRAFT_409099 [Aspergillus ellipticus CBS 707.79]
MVRIKFTGPPSTVQVQAQAQAPQNLHTLASNSRPVTRVKAQDVIEAPPELRLEERVSLKQQQSLELVQIMLHVSFGTLFYLREFLPLPCFDDRDLREAQRESNLSYRQFIDNEARVSDVPFGQGRKGQPLKIIIRGTDPKADMILDILETGIFDALSRNVLEAVQLTILVDKDAPDNVLESYTFSFKYTGGSRDIDSRLESLSIEPMGYVADIKSAQTARIGLETIVRRLITLSAFLPTLPNKRNLGVHLFYTDDCPPDYEPPGFNEANDDLIKFPLNKNWRRETQSCGSMDSGWHTVGLKITSLKWTGPEPEGSEAPPQVPPGLEYNDAMRRMEDIGFEDKEDMLRTMGSIPSVAVENPGPAVEDRPCATEDLPEAPPQRTDDLAEGTQDLAEGTQDLADKLQLQMMLPSQGTSQESDLMSTQPIKPTITIEENDAPPAESGKFILTDDSRDKIQEFFRSHDLDASKTAEGQSPVQCQCGWDGEEAAMIECAFCQTRQHLLCYGYENSSDPRVPDVHACYQCLLKPAESELLREMSSLVLLRRAVRIILGEGYPSTTSIFTQKLHCNGQTVVQITDLLKKRKLLQPTSGYKSKGFLRRGLPKFSIPALKDAEQRLQEEILSPMIKIQHHYVQGGPQDEFKLSRSVTGDELEPIAKSMSQEDEESPSEIKASVQERQKSPERTAEVVETRLTRKRKASMTSGSSQQNTTKSVDELQPERLGRVLRKDSKKEAEEEANVNKTPKQVNKTPKQTPAHRKLGDSSLRRSSRKRRKISNYSKIIDVGAENSDKDAS